MYLWLSPLYFECAETLRRQVFPQPRHAAVKMAGHSARYRTFPADRETNPTRAVSLAPDYLRRIARLEAMPDNASGADKSWVHRAHADAVHHLSSAKRR